MTPRDVDPADVEARAVAGSERRLAEAHTRLDLDTLDELLHPEYVVLQPGGTIETKAEVLASFRAGRRRWDAAESDRLDVRINGGTAIVLGRWRAAGRNGAETFDYEARFLSVWVKEGGRWRNVAYSAAPIRGV